MQEQISKSAIIMQSREPGETGVFNLSNEAYHGSDGISSTSLKKILESPKDFQYAINNPKEETRAMVFGTAVHEYLLEHDKFSKTYAVEPEIEKVFKKDDEEKYKKNKEIIEEFQKAAERKKIISAPTYERVKSCAESVKSHRYWQRIIKRSQIEVAYYTEINGVICKAKPDIQNNICIYDLKTTATGLSNRKLKYTILDRQYDFSAAMYLEIVRKINPNQNFKFAWIFVDSSPPHSCRIVEASSEDLEEAREDFYKALELYKQCSESNNWPGPKENIETIELRRR